MEVRPHRTINRKKTKKITLGNVIVGGDSPITVQSMTNTPSPDTSLVTLADSDFRPFLSISSM